MIYLQAILKSKKLKNKLLKNTFSRLCKLILSLILKVASFALPQKLKNISLIEIYNLCQYLFIIKKIYNRFYYWFISID